MHGNSDILNILERTPYLSEWTSLCKGCIVPRKGAAA